MVPSLEPDSLQSRSTLASFHRLIRSITSILRPALSAIHRTEALQPAVHPHQASSLVPIAISDSTAIRRLKSQRNAARQRIPVGRPDCQSSVRQPNQSTAGTSIRPRQLLLSPLLIPSNRTSTSESRFSDYLRPPNDQQQQPLASTVMPAISTSHTRGGSDITKRERPPSDDTATSRQSKIASFFPLSY